MVDSFIGLVTNELAGVMVEVGVFEVAVDAIVLAFARLESCSTDVLAGMLVSIIMHDTLAGVLKAGMLAEGSIWIVSAIAVAVLLELNVNSLAAVTTLEFTMPAPLEKSWYFC